MRHQFTLGSTYRFVGNTALGGHRNVVVLKFLQECDHYYKCMVCEGSDEAIRHPVGEVIEVYKNSRVLNVYAWTEIARDTTIKEVEEEQKQPARRRTREEIEVDDLFDYVQRDIRMKKLWEQIDELLIDCTEHDTLVRLSKEYAALKAQQRKAIAKQKVVRR